MIKNEIYEKLIDGSKSGNIFMKKRREKCA